MFRGVKPHVILTVCSHQDWPGSSGHLIFEAPRQFTCIETAQKEQLRIPCSILNVKRMALVYSF